MVTDLIHLNQFQFNFYAGLNLGEWKYFTYLLLGVFLAVYVMILIYFEILTLTSHRWLNRLIVVVPMFLNGFEFILVVSYAYIPFISLMNPYMF